MEDRLKGHAPVYSYTDGPELEIQVVETVIEKEVNVLKWWQKVLMWAGAAAIAYAFSRVIILIIKC